ncbi:MAG TPA: nucleotide exchange factor GrpE [Myxococcales bacterium LLY-WYZ-16_1]|nr:nucleotide exchange factor GrpE [Myxococcales bacterium LLY-WYZ-16_1]
MTEHDRNEPEPSEVTAEGSPEPQAEAAEAGSDPQGEELQAAKSALEEEFDALKRERDELKDRWMRSAADFENYKRRAAKEREEVQKYANEKLLRDLLPVIDDLDRAVQVVSEQAGSEQVREGVEMVRKKFLAQLEKHGVVSFESTGATFDPNVHEAVQQAHSPDVPAGQVLSELQRGFTIQGRLLRPAMVIVSLGPSEG